MLALLLALIGCAHRGESCCVLDDGTVGWVATAACADTTDRELCEDVGDPDGDLTPDDTEADPVAACAAYCEAIREVCPSDSACEESCSHADHTVTAEEQACAEDAPDCRSTGVCWDLLLEE